MSRFTRRLVTVAAAAAMATPVLTIAAPNADAATYKVTAQAFGMHWLNTGHPYPTMPFGSARIWDMGVTWADLQPNPPQTDVFGNVTSTGYDMGAVAHLDNIVQTFASHGVQPLLTLGRTPGWDADTSTCNAAYQTYGVGTCAPKEWDVNSPWATYVRALALRYDGHHGHPKITYFETWNEPALRNGYNGPDSRLALMQQTAHQVLQAVGAGQQLLSPSVSFTNGSPTNGLNYLNRFLGYSGGTSFDIVSFHLYPTDAISRANYGPEWTMDQLVAARKVLSAHHIGGRAVWNTEVNVGRKQSGTNFGGTAGAAQLARTYVLNLESGVQRLFWYAADDRTWGGTILVNSDYRTLTAAGIAEKALRGLLVNATTRGCSRTTVGSHKWNYTCKFHLANGKNMLALWTTGSKYTFKAGSGTNGYYTVAGARKSARSGMKFTITGTPVYVYGTFRV